jgi:hypothetical protein
MRAVFRHIDSIIRTFAPDFMVASHFSSLAGSDSCQWIGSRSAAILLEKVSTGPLNERVKRIILSQLLAKIFFRAAAPVKMHS